MPSTKTGKAFTRPILIFTKYNDQFRQIDLAIWTNIFSNLDKYSRNAKYKYWEGFHQIRDMGWTLQNTITKFHNQFVLQNSLVPVLQIPNLILCCLWTYNFFYNFTYNFSSEIPLSQFCRYPAWLDIVFHWSCTQLSIILDYCGLLLNVMIDIVKCWIIN